MQDVEVTQEGAQSPQNGAPPSAGRGKDDTVSISKAELEALRRDRDEARQSERFWAEKAQNGSGGQPAEEEEPETVETADLIERVTGDQDIDEAIFKDPDRWADAISRGPQAIESFVRKAGYVTAQEAADIAAKVARRTVDVERQKITSDNVLLRDFPDLSNPESELFKATSLEVRKLVSLDPNARKSPATLYAAAEMAKAKLGAKQTARRRDDDDDRYDRVEGEADRRHRADAQDGTRNRGRNTEDDVDMLGPEAKAVMASMGITAEEFMQSRRELNGQMPRGRR